VKGGSFEREICSKLSLWWSNEKRDDIFGRSDGSGGRFTARQKKGKDTANMSGDVTFTDSIGEPFIKAWNIEAKTGYGGKQRIKDDSGNTVKRIQKRWDLLDCLDSRQGTPVFFKMWEQCTRDANLSNRTPVLIFRRNDRAACIAIESKHFLDISSYCGDFPSICLILKSDIGKITVMPLQNFFDWFHDPAVFFIKHTKSPQGGSKFKRSAKVTPKQ
jgi:hypothetical protein